LQPFLIIFLFHDAFNNSDNIASDGMAIHLLLLGKDVKGNGRGLISSTTLAFVWRNLGKP
jgi:hypothetical protein